jgi:hypothetical protein
MELGPQAVLLRAKHRFARLGLPISWWLLVRMSQSPWRMLALEILNRQAP